MAVRLPTSARTMGVIVLAVILVVLAVMLVIGLVVRDTTGIDSHHPNGASRAGATWRAAAQV